MGHICGAMPDTGDCCLYNMIGALTMLVLEKQKDISVLHALGANNNFIQRIFLSEGLLLEYYRWCCQESFLPLL